MQRSLLIPLFPALLLCACASTEPDAAAHSGAPHHDKPIVEKDGRTLLYAGEDDWFDVTDSSIDPASFQYGIGRDTIPSIDEPVFVRADDPKLEAVGIDMDTMVLGVSRGGVSKAYPVHLMDGHEIVNDDFGGESFAVLW